MFEVIYDSYLQLKNHDALFTILPHFRVVNRKWRAWLVVVDVIDSDADFSDGASGHDRSVAAEH